MFSRAVSLETLQHQEHLIAMGSKYKSDFLFAQPTLLSGAARVLDLGGRLDKYNESSDADGIALANDWFMVGEDLKQVLHQATDELFAAV